MKLACFNSFHPQPVTIDALAYDPSGSILAQGSADGSITLFDAPYLAPIGRIPSCKSRSVRRLIFYKGYLISSGVHGSASMWDLSTLSEVSAVESSQGAIWDMALDGDKLYLATETGSVVVVDVSPGELSVSSFFRSTSKASSVRALSICVESGHIFVGDASGTISRWTRGGVCDATFSIPTKNSIPALIWALGACGEDQIASGDSLGCVSLWDANSCTLIQTRQDHQADVLTLVTRGKEIYSSGVDARVVRYTLKDNQLNFLSTYGVLARDVAALAVSDYVVIAGGADARLGLVNPKSGVVGKLDRFTLQSIVKNDRVFCQHGPNLIRGYQLLDEMTTSFAKLDNVDDIACFAVNDTGDRIVLAGANSGKVRVLSITDDGVSEEKSIAVDGTVSSVAINDRHTVIAIAGKQVIIDSPIESTTVVTTPPGFIVNQIRFISENRFILAGGKDIYCISQGTLKKIESYPSVITAVSEAHDGVMFVFTADHQALHAISLDPLEKKPLAATKKLHQKINRYSHVKSIEISDEGMLCLVGETYILTSKLDDLVSFQFNSTIPTGGLVIGSGMLLGSSSAADSDNSKRVRKNRGVVAILATTTETSRRLITPFERKQYQH